MKTSCPDIQALSDYIEGSVSSEEKDRMYEHLSVCDTCREEFVAANRLMQDNTLFDFTPATATETRLAVKKIGLCPPNKRSLADGVLGRSGFFKRSRFFKWMTAGPQMPLPMELAAVRKKTSAVNFEYILVETNIDGLKLSLFAEKEAGNSFRMRIRLLEEIPNVRITLTDETGMVLSRPLTQGFAHMEKLSFGQWRLILSHRGSEKGEYRFGIDKSGFRKRDADS